MQGLYKDNGKENGNYYSGLRIARGWADSVAKFQLDPEALSVPPHAGKPTPPQGVSRE